MKEKTKHILYGWLLSGLVGSALALTLPRKVAESRRRSADTLDLFYSKVNPGSSPAKRLTK